MENSEASVGGRATPPEPTVAPSVKIVNIDVAQFDRVRSSALEVIVASNERLQPLMSSITASLARQFDVAAMMPKVNIVPPMPSFDFLKSMPVLGIRPLPNAIDVSALKHAMPTFDMKNIGGAGFASSLLGGFEPIDTRGILSTITASQAGFASTISKMQPLFDIMRGTDWSHFMRRLRTPDNWTDDVDDRFDALVAMVNDEGVPAAWVPRSETLLALLNAAPGDARSEVLIEHRDEILEDCEAALADIDDAFLADVMPLAREVLDSCRVGHWRVAALAAVPIVHGIVESLHWVYNRQGVVKHHSLSVETPFGRVVEQATRAPLILFYQDWNPRSGRPRPRQITRHVVSHWLGSDQVTERNCIVAVMLMSSMLVTVSQLGLGQKEIAA